MTINVPIRPSAALNDPETRAFVEDRIINARYDFITRHSYLPDRAYNKEGIVNILANFPWREYGYKFGRWRRKPVISELPFIPWYAWEVTYDTLLLTDPNTGQEIAEVNGLAMHMRPPAGRVLFAGDPHYAGVINRVIKGERRMSIVGSARLSSPEYDQIIAARARDLTKVMVPGHPPQATFYNPPKSYLDSLGPWVADHPEKPPKPKKR